MKTLKENTECPICKAEAKLVGEMVSKTFRGEKYNVYEQRYVCQSCEFEYTNSQIDTLNVEQIYNLYRSEHKIPFPQEIENLREKYQLSQNKMSEFLGLGVNMYRKYEMGEMPSKSNGMMIRDLFDNGAFESHFTKNQHLLSEKEIRKIKTILFEEYIGIGNYENGINKYSGFQEYSISKAGNLLIFFLNEFKHSYKTKLNKLFFYSDFFHFKNHGSSITGLEYAAISYGPVPNNYTKTYGELEFNGYISIVDEDFGDFTTDKFIPKKSFDDSIFNETELETLNHIKTKFKNSSREEIVNLSHEEEGWKKNKKNKSLISYTDFAFILKGV
ncbi:MAG: DUF4065 domain-containing protein [Crocinitomicaceae bacterium]